MSFLDEARVPINVGNRVGVKIFIDMDKVAEDVQINPNDIENSMISVASIYNRYAHMVAMARIQRDGFKSRKNLLAAQLEKAIRDKAAVDDEKLTNPQVEAKIARNANMVQADLDLNESIAVLSACTETLSAVSMKRDMLVQLNKNRQNEFNMTSSRVPGSPQADIGLGRAPKPEKPDISDVV